jgi:5-methylthioadenosine/S-adenosylhomocysteine deaminase
MQRPEFLIRNAYVVTMDERLGDLADADVHVTDGCIVAVGSGVKAPKAEVIDGRGMIVLPGLVDTHWHLWTSLLRSMAGDKPQWGYFPTSRGVGVFYTADDMYRAARLAAAEALHSGITFVHDWCHNVRSAQHADADLRALRESGIRARFSYGIAAGQKDDERIELDDLRRLHDSWQERCGDGLLTLGMAWRGCGGGTLTACAREEYAFARERDLPVSVHANNFRASAGGIALLAREGLLGPSVQVIHAIWASAREIEAMASSGASLSLSPCSELRIGFGLPRTGDFLAAGVEVGLSVDTTTLAGSADMFGIMKLLLNLENGRSEDECRLPARRVLEMATLGGARCMGVADRTGSLTPGKRADLIMVDTRAVNLGPFADAAHLLVEAAQPANVDTVVVDGRILKRHGILIETELGEVLREARGAVLALWKRAGGVVGGRRLY